MQDMAKLSYQKMMNEAYTSDIVKILNTDIEEFDSNQTKFFLGEITNLIGKLEDDGILVQKPNRIKKKNTTMSDIVEFSILSTEEKIDQ